MKQARTPRLNSMALAWIIAISAGVFAIMPAMAQNQQMADKLMAIKDAQAANKQKLAQYTWTEIETISLKGEVKDTKTYQVSMVNGQAAENSSQQPGGKLGRRPRRPRQGAHRR